MKKGFVKIVFTVVAIYALLGLFYAMSLVPSAGDEVFFTDDLNFIKKNGWIEAIKKNISIPYLLLVYPFTFFVKNFVAIRLVNILLGIGLYFYFFYRNKPSIAFYTYLTFYLGTSKVFFLGTNDALFVFGLVLFFNETYKLIKNEKWIGSLAILGLLISFFTRKMIIVYIPVILYVLYMIYRFKGYNKGLLKTSLITIILFLIFNSPSLISNARLSYDLKLPSKHYKATWEQRQYLAQLMVNEGTLNNKSHPTFRETQEYLDNNGENSLPKNVFEGILFDPILTIKEFFKDFFDVLLYGFRQLGLMIIVPFFFLFLSFNRKSLFTSQVFIPMILFISMCTFSLIIISFVELRWLASVFIICVVFYHYLERKKSLPINLIKLNNIILILLSFYGVYRILPKIMA